MNQSLIKKSLNFQRNNFQGITKISVAGYKSIANQSSIDISNLTILAGANSSGKSSIMQPLLLMKQTLEATYDPGALLLNGSNVKFTSTEQIFSKISSSLKKNNFEIEIEINQSDLLRLTFSTKRKGIDLSQMSYQEQDKSQIILRPNMTQDEIKNSCPKELAELYKEIENDEISKFISFQIERIRCFLRLHTFLKQHNQFISPVSSSLLGIQSQLLMFQSLIGFRSLELFERYIRSIIHVPGLRGNPERNYPVTAIGKEFPGTFENYVASVINDWQIEKSPKIKELAKYLTLLGLTGKVDTKQINDTQVEIRVARLPCNANTKAKATDMVSIADVGFGVSQTLPAIVALLVAEPNQLVYLEQPEIHLHPRAQASLADILVKAANRGVRVVIETHSDLILKRIQSLVAEDIIHPDKVKLHWFTRNQEGITEVTTAALDKAGTFGDWPEDFSEVDLQEESRYLDAAELKMMSEFDEK